MYSNFTQHKKFQRFLTFLICIIVVFLGDMYFKGTGIQQNIPMAISLWKQAARQGNKESQEKLKKIGELW